MHNYRSLIRKPRERRQCKHNARTKLPPAATKCKCTTTGHCFNLQVQHATMPSTTGALRSSCVLTSKCDTELQAETRCHDAVEPLLFPALLHGMRNKNCHTSIYEWATCCPVHGQHSEHVPFCEAPLQKFLPGHPGAIHDPWSQHCYAAPATEFPRHRTTRTTRSHAPFARTFPSANETAITKCPQTSRVRDFNQTFCIQKFRDMHICSLDFKTMPWHAWFQNKIERYKIERYNDSRSIFLSTAHAFQWKHHIYFFRAIHHIDPLHRKQTLTLSQCSSRDLTDSPYRNLEKCQKC